MIEFNVGEIKRACEGLSKVIDSDYPEPSARIIHIRVINEDAFLTVASPDVQARAHV